MDSPLKNHIHKAQIDDNDDLVLADALSRKYNLTSTYFNDFEFRMLRKKNFIIDIYGDTGSGKSIIAQYTASYVQSFIETEIMKPLIEKVVDEHGRKPVFDSSNICFDTSEIMQRIKECVPFETIIYDEAGSEKTVGTGSLREKYDKERIMKRIRGDQNNFIFCDPLTDDTKIADLYLYRLRTFDIDYKHELNRSIIEAKNLYGSWGIYGHIITQKFEVDGYAEKKQKQIDDIKNFEFGGGRQKVYNETAEKLIKMGIGKYPKSDWNGFVEEWTKGQFAKGEIQKIKLKIGYYLAIENDVEKGDETHA